MNTNNYYFPVLLVARNEINLRSRVSQTFSLAPSSQSEHSDERKNTFVLTQLSVTSVSFHPL